MMTTRQIASRVLGIAALTTAIVGAGCVDTELQGVIIEDDVRDPALMLPLVRGINSELQDNMRDFEEGVWWITGSATDEFNNDGTATATEEIWEYGNYDERPGDFPWVQVLEAAWSAYYGISILEEVLEDADSDPLTAQAWIIAGWAERMFGEIFCEGVYTFEPGAGPLIGPNDHLDGSRTVPIDSAFRRSLNAMQNALRVAEAARAGNAAVPDGDVRIFGLDNLVYKAHGGIAQAAALLGDWALAVEHASQVPDDFIAYSHADPEVEGNAWHAVSFQNDDFTLWNTPLHRQWPDDPRAPWIKCGDFRNGDAVMTHGSASSIINTGLCSDIPGKNGEFRAESNTMPLYGSMKSMDDVVSRPGGEQEHDADFPMVRGTEMRLIRAEAALVAGNLGEFKAQIDAARAVYNLPPIPMPASAGALEYPNAEDDAWSILDRERYLTLHLEGRRLADMRRWQHPYISEGHMINTRVLEENGAHRPNYCLPVADIECDANSGLFCQTLTGG